MSASQVTARLAPCLRLAPVGVVLVDREGQILAMNPRCAELCGADASAAVGMASSALWSVTRASTGDGPALVATLARAGLGDLELTVTEVPDSDGVKLAYLRPRSDDRRAAELARRLTTLLQNLPGMAYRCANDRDWTMEFVSDGALDLTGYTPQEFLDPHGVTFGSIIDPEDRDVVWEQVRSALLLGEPFRLAYRIRTRHGQLRWCWEEGLGIHDAHGKVVALEGYIVDITNERLALEAARSSEAYLGTVLHSLTEAVCATDGAGRVTLLNPAAAELSGVSIGEAVGRPVRELFSFVDDEGTPLASDPFATALGQGRQRQTLIDRMGGKHAVSYAISSLVSAETGADGSVLVARDITQQVELEEQLRQATKMEAIGRLAGGIAHDFNNLLTGIMGYADLLHEELEGREEELSRYASLILETSRRAAELTTQLTAFGRRRKIGREVVDIHGVIADVTALFVRTVDPRVVVESRLEAAWASVIGDRSLLQNAFLNIALNARDAMPDGGVVTFETRLREVAPGDPELVGDRDPGAYLDVRVSDTGTGIPPADLQRIFEPFYTSKGGHGTGLGLAATYGTVVSHRGLIRAENRPGGGAMFVVSLPVRGLEEIDADLFKGAGQAVIRGSGRILLGEDDTVVRRLLTVMLERLGYDVDAHNDGRAVVEAFAQSPGSYDLVMLDARMPVMSGEEAFEQIVVIREGVRVLMSSGHRRDSPARPQMKGFLPKPYDLASLSQMVAHALRD